MTVMQVRRMSAGDLWRVVEIAASLAHAPRWPESAYLAAMNAENLPQRIALVAEDSGTVMGFVIASVVAQEAELEMIAVAAEAHRRGLGGKLLEALLAELRAAHVSDLILEVRTSNGAAQGLYRAGGFVECGRRLRYYADPEEDAVLMRMGLL